MLHDVKLAALTQGKNIASTRFRWSQYTSILRSSGINTTEFESAHNAYPPEIKIARPSWLLKSIFENAVRTIRSNSFDIRFLQRNLTSTLCTWEPLLHKPMIFDVDDAIFLGPRGFTANKIATHASIIICGNSFLANHFSQYGKVEILPTAVDTKYFTPMEKEYSSDFFLGWSGSSSGFRYLYEIEPALDILFKKYSTLKLKIVADIAPIFLKLPIEKVVFERWKPDREVSVLNEFSIGLMPLSDDLWSRGKCSFKMLTYMSMALPVVVSPVGMNAEILAQSFCGFGASSIDDWVEAISTLIENKDMRAEAGCNGRKIVEETYSRELVAKRLVEIIKEQLP